MAITIFKTKTMSRYSLWLWLYPHSKSLQTTLPILPTSRLTLIMQATVCTFVTSFSKNYWTNLSGTLFMPSINKHATFISIAPTKLENLNFCGWSIWQQLRNHKSGQTTNSTILYLTNLLHNWNYTKDNKIIKKQSKVWKVI